MIKMVEKGLEIVQVSQEKTVWVVDQARMMVDLS